MTSIPNHPTTASDAAAAPGSGLVPGPGPGPEPGLGPDGVATRSKEAIVADWLPRYTGMPLEEFGDYILLTNFKSYIEDFAARFDSPIRGRDRPMQAVTAPNGITMVNFGIGTANVATITDLLTAVQPAAVLFLGKCGGLKPSTEIGHFILPIAAIRGEGTSLDYFPAEVPALPSFKLHKFVSEKIVDRGLDYRTGVVYTTNRRVWEHDVAFLEKLRALTVLAIDMETATFFIVAHANQIPHGALLLVSDTPYMLEGIKSEASDAVVTRDWSQVHLELGIEAMTDIATHGEQIRHFHF